MNETPKPKAVRGSQGPFCIWHGLQFGKMLQLFAQKPPMHISRALRIGTVMGMSVVNSLTNLVERMLYSRKLRKVELAGPPVFVLGHWRSGTTLLHNLFTQDPQFTYPNLYLVFFPGAFLWTEWFMTRLTRPLLPKTRPMDNVAVGWQLPQEDETALCTMTLVSPYNMLAHQNNRSKYERFFDLLDLSPRELKEWQDALMLLLKKMTLRVPKPVVLKSPTHTYRVKRLLEMFPDAKFVYLYRNPYAVYSSSMHLRKTMFEENALGKIDYAGIEEGVFETYLDCFHTYERDRHLIPPGQLVEVRFEDLEADPLEEMRKVYAAVGLDFSGLEAQLAPQVESLRKFRKNEFRRDEELLRRVYERWKPAFERYGYPSQLDTPAPSPS